MWIYLDTCTEITENKTHVGGRFFMQLDVSIIRWSFFTILCIWYMLQFTPYFSSINTTKQMNTITDIYKTTNKLHLVHFHRKNYANLSYSIKICLAKNIWSVTNYQKWNIVGCKSQSSVIHEWWSGIDDETAINGLTNTFNLVKWWQFL